MELNFDKEMDALLRQTARQEKSAPAAAESHLDADELAAFAAGALPLKARTRAAGHLADCGNCRTTVANLVFFEDREAEKTAAVAATAPIGKSASLLEQLKAFFTVQTLAYSMGGLVLLFSAALAFMFLRGPGNIEMAQANTSVMERSSVAQNAAPASGEVSDRMLPEIMAANSSANAAPMASAANSATGGAFTGGAPAFGARPANTNAAYTCEDCGSPSDDEVGGAPAKLPDKKETDVKKDLTLDGVDAQQTPAAAPRYDAPLAKPQTEQNVRSQDNYQRQNNNIMMPDGGDRDRKRSVNAEAGATVTITSEPAERSEKLKQAAPPPPPAKSAVGKPAKKSQKKKAAAEAPAPTPTPSPVKKPEEEHPPCK